MFIFLFSSLFHINYEEITQCIIMNKWSLGPYGSFSSVQFSLSVVSDSLRPHESQHARPPCPSASPRFHSDSRPSSPWYHPAISSSVVPFSCPQSVPASEIFSKIYFILFIFLLASFFCFNMLLQEWSGDLLLRW